MGRVSLEFPSGRRPFAIVCGTFFGLPLLAAIAAAALRWLADRHHAAGCPALPPSAWYVLVPLTGVVSFVAHWAMWERMSASRVLGSLVMTALTLVFTVLAGLFVIAVLFPGPCGT